MLTDDAVGDGEAEAGAARIEAGGDEGVEDFGEDVGGNAGAIVFHFEVQPVAAAFEGDEATDLDMAAGLDGRLWRRPRWRWWKL